MTTTGLSGSKSLVPPWWVLVVYHNETRSSLETKSIYGIVLMVVYDQAAVMGVSGEAGTTERDTN